LRGSANGLGTPPARPKPELLEWKHSLPPAASFGEWLASPAVLRPTVRTVALAGCGGGLVAAATIPRGYRLNGGTRSAVAHAAKIPRTVFLGKLTG